MEIISTNSIRPQDRERTDLNGFDFDKCEICEHITTRLTKDDDVKLVKFYTSHKMALCDQCVDWLNGQAWVDRNGEHLENETSKRQFKWLLNQKTDL
jgi:hypothetical protein